MSAPTVSADPRGPAPLREETAWDKTKYKVYGLVLLLIIAVFIGLCVAQFNQAFQPRDQVMLSAGRAGLQMYPGNRVQMRGVDVGKVGEVTRNAEGGVDLVLDMYPDQMANIPANPNVALSQLTAFGAKTVQFTDPARAVGQLEPGARLDAGQITVEVNTLFQRLQTVLNTAEPAKVSAILGGLSQTLNGRGDEIGQTVESLNAYLKNFNTQLPQLRRDFQKGATVVNTYADVAPDLLQTLDNLRVPARTLVEQQGQLDGFLYQLTKFGNTGQSFFAQNRDGLINVSKDLLPITSLLKKYSPEFSCFIKGVDEAGRRERTQQGEHFPGFEGNTTFEYGRNKYEYPKNLPVVGTNNGPDCNGLPYITAPDVPAGLFKKVDKGGTVTDSPNITTSDEPLVATLFGPNATLPFQQTPQAGGNVNTTPGGTDK